MYFGGKKTVSRGEKEREQENTDKKTEERVGLNTKLILDPISHDTARVHIIEKALH